MSIAQHLDRIALSALIPCSAQHTPGPVESDMQKALRRLLREYIYTRTMDGTSEADCETMECVSAARAALAKASGSAA